jgi:hypothetical protein
MLLCLALIGCVALGAWAGAAHAASAQRTLSYRGLRLVVPRGWPVFRLATAPHTCVRFDRHAVYLGRPGAEESCPVQPAGRTEAILVQPLAKGAGPPAGAGMPSGSSLRLIERAHRVVITATWNRHPAIVRRALGLRSLAAAAGGSQAHPPAAPTASRRVRSFTTRATATTPTPATPGQVYTGSGFDTCSTPSTAQMTAWNASPYRAVGVYIGGADRACAEPNLTAAWVSRQSAAGWHLIPIYVGLQAPGNGCGCSSFTAAGAVADGAGEAADAVTDAQAIGLGAGNPIYFDLEAYTASASANQTVLSFLQAWTEQLHADGYLSGVYSSEGSGIAALVSVVGTGYHEPDDIWIANWNQELTTNDPKVPSADWSDHQRLHQYEGAHDETYGGTKLNIDGDYLDAATAAAGAGTLTPPAPPASVKPPTITGAPLSGQTLTESHAVWSGSPASYTYQWQDCTTDGTDCVAIPGAVAQSYTAGAGDVGHTLEVVEVATGAGGTGSPAVSAATGIVAAKPTSGYWLYSAFGNIFNGPGAGFYGSAVRQGGSTITGMTATRDDHGYWLTESAGRVLAYGDAARFGAPRTTRPVRGIVGDPAGSGYWQYTAYGNVMANRGSRFYGSPAWSGIKTSSIAGMAATGDGRGYWLVQSSGRVYAYGDAQRYSVLSAPHPVKGIVRDPAGPGAWLFTAQGNVIALGGAPSYGSATASGIVAMAATPDGHGYWLISGGGRLYPFGDAPTFPVPGHAHPITGIVTS